MEIDQTGGSSAAIGAQRKAPSLRSPAELRVALFTGAYNHIADGVSLTLNRLVRYLEEEGVQVRVFAPTVSDPPIEHAGTLTPVPSISVPGRPEYRASFGLLRSARRDLKEFNPNIIHIATPDALGRSALGYARRRGIPVVASYHTHFSSYLKYYHLTFLEGVLWRYLRRFYRACQHVYVPSQAMEDVLSSHGIERLLRWPRGVDTSLFSPTKRSLPWRRSLGIGDDEVVIAFVSRLVWEKGLRVFADVVRGLQDMDFPHRVVIVGDGPARAELKDQIPSALFVGYLSGTDLARAYASSDVFLFPSETETFGNVTLEAMASGLPAICADAAGSNTLVVPGVTGYLAPPGDSAAFLAHAVDLISDSERRREMGEAARQKAMRYAWDITLASMLRYYRMLMDADRSDAGRKPPVSRVRTKPLGSAVAQ